LGEVGGGGQHPSGDKEICPTPQKKSIHRVHAVYRKGDTPKMGDKTILNIWGFWGGCFEDAPKREEKELTGAIYWEKKKNPFEGWGSVGTHKKKGFSTEGSPQQEEERPLGEKKKGTNAHLTKKIKSSEP